MKRTSRDFTVLNQGAHESFAPRTSAFEDIASNVQIIYWLYRAWLNFWGLGCFAKSARSGSISTVATVPSGGITYSPQARGQRPSLCHSKRCHSTCNSLQKGPESLEFFSSFFFSFPFIPFHFILFHIISIYFLIENSPLMALSVRQHWPSSRIRLGRIFEVCIERPGPGDRAKRLQQTTSSRVGRPAGCHMKLCLLLQVELPPSTKNT